MRKRLLLVLAAVTASLMLLGGCGRAIPGGPCAGHGGIRYFYKGIYKCRDGYFVGAGCLLLHGDDRKAVRECAHAPLWP